jgi:uncharacterized protein YjbI with pentapeptide repeats
VGLALRFELLPERGVVGSHLGYEPARLKSPFGVLSPVLWGFWRVQQHPDATSIILLIGHSAALEGARLDGAILVGADLRYTDLTYTDLSYTDVS